MPNQFSLHWRTPILAGMRLPLALQIPDDVRSLKDPATQELTDLVLTRCSIEAGLNGLAGKRIEFPGLQGTITDVLVRVEMFDGLSWTTIVRLLAWMLNFQYLVIRWAYHIENSLGFATMPTSARCSNSFTFASNAG